MPFIPAVGAYELFMGGSAIIGGYMTAHAANNIANSMHNQSTPPEASDGTSSEADQHAAAGEGANSTSPQTPPGPPCKDCDQNKRDNKKKHIFGKSQHNLDGLVNSFGGDQDKALDAIQQAAQNIGQGTTGPFEGVANINGYDVTIRGAMVGGTAEVGTAFIPP